MTNNLNGVIDELIAGVPPKSKEEKEIKPVSDHTKILC